MIPGITLLPGARSCAQRVRFDADAPVGAMGAAWDLHRLTRRFNRLWAGPTEQSTTFPQLWESAPEPALRAFRGSPGRRRQGRRGEGVGSRHPIDVGSRHPTVAARGIRQRLRAFCLMRAVSSVTWL